MDAGGLGFVPRVRSSLTMQGLPAWERVEAWPGRHRADTRRRAILNRARKRRAEIRTALVNEGGEFVIYIYGTPEHRERAIHG